MTCAASLAFYGNARVDAMLPPYDALSIGIPSSLKGVGYGTPKQPIPVVSGQDAEVGVGEVDAARRTELHRLQYTRELAKVTVNMTDEMLSGKKVDIMDTKTYNNGVKDVPSYLLKPVSADVSNRKPILIDTEYYKEAQIK